MMMAVLQVIILSLTKAAILPNILRTGFETVLAWRSIPSRANFGIRRMVPPTTTRLTWLSQGSTAAGCGLWVRAVVTRKEPVIWLYYRVRIMLTHSFRGSAQLPRRRSYL